MPKENNTGKKWKFRGGISPAFSTVFSFTVLSLDAVYKAALLRKADGFVLRRGYLHAGSPCCRHCCKPHSTTPYMHTSSINATSPPQNIHLKLKTKEKTMKDTQKAV